jgi:hypothetical protein
LSVSIGARVMANAGPSEVLVSQTVKDLVAGSGLAVEDAGEHELKAFRTDGASIGCPPRDPADLLAITPLLSHHVGTRGRRWSYLHRQHETLEVTGC